MNWLKELLASKINQAKIEMNLLEKGKAPKTFISNREKAIERLTNQLESIKKVEAVLLNG